MSKTTKALLVLSALGLVSGMVFVTGLVKVGDAVAWYITLPAGAILFGLFLISKLLEKEVAMHDVEQASTLVAATQFAGNNPPAAKPCCQKPAPRHKEALASAH